MIFLYVIHESLNKFTNNSDSWKLGIYSVYIQVRFQYKSITAWVHNIQLLGDNQI